MGTSVFETWSPLLARVTSVLERIAIDDTTEPPLDELLAITISFRADARARGKDRFADSPPYPWGIVEHVDNLYTRLKYQQLGRSLKEPCNCALVIEHEMYSMLDTKDFEKTGTSDDHYDPYDDFRCLHCGRWRHADRSTEQYSSSVWFPRPG